jgi:hypothetical protein
VILALCLTSGHPSAQRLSVSSLLDRYAAGDFDAVAALLATKIDFEDLLKQLKADGPAWIISKGSEARELRELTAATFALEAARADEWNQWRVRQRQPPIEAPDGPPYNPPDVLYWRPPPLLIEWGCQLFRRDPTPRPVERLWQLAALAVAERAEDADFLVGTGGQPVANSQDEIVHLRHVLDRFPNEPRFKLAHAIATEWRTWPQRARWPGSMNASRADAAMTALLALQDEVDIAAEVSLRVGALHLRRREPDEALKRFERVESTTREPYLIYLARFFTAQAFEAKARQAKGPEAPEREAPGREAPGRDATRYEAEAARAYRRALATVPHAQSAALPVAAFLFKVDRRAEAYEVVEDALKPDLLRADPWRGYADADDRFWPLLITHLRRVIHP